MKLQSEIKSEIIRYSKELRLPVFRNEFEQVARDAAKEGTDYETFLLRLMEREYDTRLENRKKAQIRQAGFPAKLYLHDLKRDLLPVDAAEKLTLLERLDFVASGRNIILAGNPGSLRTEYHTGRKSGNRQDPYCNRAWPESLPARVQGLLYHRTRPAYSITRITRTTNPAADGTAF